jgi:hypothetical protein
VEGATSKPRITPHKPSCFRIYGYIKSRQESGRDRTEKTNRDLRVFEMTRVYLRMGRARKDGVRVDVVWEGVYGLLDMVRKKLQGLQS